VTEPSQLLFRAQTSATAVAQLSADAPFDLPAAYRIQRAVAELRHAAGERPTGFKMGFTSRAKMQQMGVHEVISGLLSSSMAWLDGDIVDPSTLIHPRIEPEVVFRLGRDVDPEESIDSAAGAVDAVAAGLEVIDSRYADFTFNLVDVVADNASAAGYAVGPWRSPTGDLANRGVVLEVDGVVAETGSTAAILGDPWRAFAAAVRMSRSLNVPLAAGHVVLAGATTAAVPFRPGTSVRATVSGLGPVTLTLGDGASS
jgi:2-oxo-3-hexenedioate decarboxylase